MKILIYFQRNSDNEGIIKVTFYEIKKIRQREGEILLSLKALIKTNLYFR